jgi:hypothetical protein
VYKLLRRRTQETGGLPAAYHLPCRPGR